LADAATSADYIARHNSMAIASKLVDAFYIVGFIVFISGFRYLALVRDANSRVRNASGALTARLA
jgi:hypothetical protein